MRKLFAFLVRLFNFWTWQDFFLRWLRSPASHPTSRVTMEQLSSQEGQQESELAHFLSSLPEGGCGCTSLHFHRDSKVSIRFGGFRLTFVHGTGAKAGYREFLEAVASSKIVFAQEVCIFLYGHESCKHEAFAHALHRSCNKFKKLHLKCWDGSAVRLAKCISSMLLANNAIEHLRLDFSSIKDEMGKEVAANFMAIIATPQNLQILKSFRISGTSLNGEGMEQLMKPFQGPPNVLEELEFDSLSSDAELEQISGMLTSSTSLKILKVSLIPTRVEKAFTRGCKSIGVALGCNQSLKSFSCKISHGMELKVLLDPLMPTNNNRQCNTTLKKLQIREAIVGKEGIETLFDLIHTNTSLLELELIRLDDLSLRDIEGIENVLAILEALKTNKCLTRIGFYYCKAVGGYKVLGAMMDLLLENHNIEDIDLKYTGLDETGDVDYVHSALLKKKKMKMQGIVQSMATANPTSGRVFLCGEPYAGKTRIRLSMKQLKEFQRNDETPNRLGFMKNIQNFRKTPNVQKVPKVDMLLECTHGIEVDKVQCDGFGITIWDMAGQTDYHSFHELVMPDLSADGSSSMFLLMCNPMQQSCLSIRKRPSKIKLELEFWLRFIASNTRKSLSYRPHVSIVMTHFDYWKDDDAFATRIEDEVLQLKSQFQEVLEFDEDRSIFKVDGRDASHAREVFDFMKSHMKQLLERLPKTIKACVEVQHFIERWNANKSNPPLLKWEEFCDGMCKEVEELNDVNHELAKRKREFVAISLNDGGHIIYNEKEGVVITNPHWFCHEIVGQFLHQCTIVDRKLEMVSNNGIISIDCMKRLILKLVEGQGDMEKQFDDILDMMIKLHICYEQDASSIMIPSTLKDKQESLSWSTNDEPASLKYVGRRLACKDGIQTMLTPGFFTRLQVSFFKKLLSKNVQDTYEVFQDIIKFISNGIEVIIQFHHGDIDILLRSHQGQDQMLEFLENGIVMHIKLLQEDSTLGCVGVRLVEYILRPNCVKQLVNAQNHKDQCVLVKDLEVEVMKIGVHATYNWKSCAGLGIDHDKVSILLGSLAWKSLLERRMRDLQDCDKKLEALGTMTQNDQSNSNVVDIATTSFGQMPRRRAYGPLDKKLDDIKREQREHYPETMSKSDEYHKETMTKLDNVVHLIQNLEHGIQSMQGKLLLKVCSKIDDLMAFSIEMQKSQIPKLAYLCEFGKRTLLTQLVPGLDRIQLHLMCESIYGFHEVVNQKGYEVHFGTENTKGFLAMIAWGLKIATILTKIGAYVACRMDAMILDFSDGDTFGALILDTPGFVDYQLPMGTIESPISDVKKHSMISIYDQFEAQRWLLEFLEPKCQNMRDFHENFQLKKVRFKGSRGSIAWICDKCFSMHHNEIDELK